MSEWNPKPLPTWVVALIMIAVTLALGYLIFVPSPVAGS